MRVYNRLRSGWIPVCLILASAAPAWAQSDADAAMRRDLIAQAQSASTAGDHARAVDLAQRAGQISMTPSLRMLIAQEQTAAGRLAEGLTTAELCSHEAERDTALRSRADILTTCHGIETSLSPRVARLTLQPPANAPSDLHVRVAGHDINRALLGVPYVVTPGHVVVEASATGMRAFRQEVTLAEGAASSLPIVLQPDVTNTAVVASARPPPVARTELAPSPVLPGVVIAAGIAGVGVSVALFVLRTMAVSQFETTQCMAPDYVHCRDTAEARGQLASASTLNTAAIVTLSAGAAVAVVGVIALLVRGGRGSHTDRARVEFGASPIASGLMVYAGGAL